MRQCRRLLLAPLALTLILAGATARPASLAAVEIPARLSDQEFWKLSEDLSEPDGTFRSENLLSNEMVFAHMLPQVMAHTKPGGVYLGVGPEQNFTYLVAMRPRIAFITDVRRGNLHVMLMYKALFELSADRAEFVSRLFTKPRPAGLSATSTSRELMDAFWDAKTGDEAAYTANLSAIHRHLTKTRTIPLPAADLDGIARAYRAFYFYGPAMNYSATTSLATVNSGRAATYWDLMTQTDANGQGLTYLATEEKFRFIKDMYNKNLIVPLVGNFSGPKTIRAIGDYVRKAGATVTAFYVSSVEPYLRRDGLLPTFCASVASLPLDDASVFIRTGNAQNLQLSRLDTSGRPTTPILPPPPPPPAVLPQVGTYQIGVVVPMKGGCG